MLQIKVNPAEIQMLNYERFNYPCPIVQKRMHAVYLKENSCEVDNLANENPGIVHRMRQQLIEWHNALPDVESMPVNSRSFEYPWPGSN